MTGVLRSRIVTHMLINARDFQIVTSVARWSQLATAQIRVLHFSGTTSSTPMYRTLERLVERKYLSRIERRMAGGSRAGSGQYVYQLGRQGWQLIGGKGDYYPRRTVSYHTLEIVDAFIELVKLQRLGRIEIAHYAAEPDSWVIVGSYELKPDLYVEISDMHKREDTALWLEIDMGTERQRVILEKLERYVKASERADDSKIPIWPLIVFLAHTDERAREIRRVIAQLPEEDQALFEVFLVTEFAHVFFG